MGRVRILPYKGGSKGAKVLSVELGALRLKQTGSRFRPREGDTIINWGGSSIPALYMDGPARVLNNPRAVGIAANKGYFFKTLAEENADLIPPFWTDRSEIPADAYPIVCRTILNGHSGAGIVIADTPEQLVHAPLYVKYIKKQDEYRIHVGGGEVIAIQRKARSRSVPDEQVDWRVRNHANGFIFARGNVSAPQLVQDAARLAVLALGLDFGAADVVWNARDEKAYVLEVNTAPGIEGSTVADYVRYFSGGEASAGGSD